MKLDHDGGVSLKLIIELMVVSRAGRAKKVTKITYTVVVTIAAMRKNAAAEMAKTIIPEK